MKHLILRGTICIIINPYEIIVDDFIAEYILVIKG